MAWSTRIRALLDSNIIYSAVCSPRGAPGKVISLFLDNRFEAVISRLVLEEVIRAVRSKMPARVIALQELLVLYPPEVCPDPRPEEVSRYARVINAEECMFTSGPLTLLASF
ncbi:MAG: PIN domain-containing protein [Chloroflexi bacterium]|nr:PIN domain-containing protein [Chloroflexota bacterium]